MDSYFREVAPNVEFRGGLIFVSPPGADYEIVFTPHTMLQFVAAANKALAKWQVAARVVPLRPPKH